MKKPLLRTALALLVLGVAYGAYVAWCKYTAVTLNVRHMEVREVIRKIERQTGTPITVHSNVQGKVTLNVRRMPLEEVLEIIGEQTFSRWSSMYPLYSSGKSLTQLEMSLRGEHDPSENGWTNLFGRSLGRDGRDGRGGPGGPGGFGGGPFGGGPGGPGGPFGESARGSNRLVSLQIEGKDVQFATLALNRFTQARVVLEDGASGLITLRLKEAKIPSAVSQLAKKAHLNWTKLYSLTGFGGFDRDRGRNEFASRRGSDDGERRRFDSENMTPEERDERRDERRKQREALEDELKQTLPPAEQAKLAEQQQQREQFRQEMSTMTPEQIRERFSQMRGPGGGGGGGRDRGSSFIKNSTPEQRVERYRRMEEMRQRRQQQGGSGRGFGR